MFAMGPGFARGSSSPFNPASIFAGGVRGGWWDPSDLSTLFQDTAGTVPVTAVGQRVQLMRDKSGNANHFTQATTAQAPFLRNDGTNNYLEFVAANTIWMTAGTTSALAPQTDSISMALGGLVNSTGTSGTWLARAEAAGLVGRYWYQPLTGTMSSNINLTAAVYTAAKSPLTTSNSVCGATIDRTGLAVISRINGVAGTATSTTSDASNLSPSRRLLLGAFNSAGDTGQQNYLDGRVFGLLLWFGPINSTTQLNAERWLGTKCGVVI